MRNLAFKNIDSVKYIITAFSSNEESCQDNYFMQLKSQLHQESDVIFNQLQTQEDKVMDI